MKNKVVNVILSTFNGEKYLEQLLHSLFIQDYPCVKIFVRDDGSVDSTCEILDKYQSQGKLTYYKGDNIGFAHSFLECMTNSTCADYYAFCDQDDVWDKNKISSSISLLENQNNNLPLLYASTARLVDKDLKYIGETAFIDSSLMSFPISLVMGVYPGCTFVFNNKLKLLLEMYPKNFNLDFHDWLTMKLAIAFGKFITDNTSHMNYRQHDNNVVGYKKSNKFVNVLKFFLNVNAQKDKGLRSSMARLFEQVYGAMLNAEDLYYVHLLGCYSQNKKLKKELLRTKVFFLNSRSRAFMFKWRVLLENY